MSAILVSDASRLNIIKRELEKLGFYDRDRRVNKSTDGEEPFFAVPITDSCCKTFLASQPLPYPFEGCRLQDLLLPPSKSALASSRSPYSAMAASLSRLPGVDGEMASDIPKSWERHGDMIVLPAASFSSEKWQSLIDSMTSPEYTEFWSTVAASLKCKRLALGNKISNDCFRSPGSKMVLGEDGWVQHVDNGVHYIFDVTKCMFSSGNITEKLRVAKFKCEGETVVDLYAGIGYFVLPYLVHGRVRHVHACDWNPHAVEALQKGLRANKVEQSCTIHHGDSTQFPLTNIADRVNLGLIPSSEDCWPVACAALKSASGGWLHIHGNVNTKPDKDVVAPQQSELTCYQQELLQPPLTGSHSVVKWMEYVTGKISRLLEERNPLAERQWDVRITNVHHLKEYAPHIKHLVLDVHCQPQSIAAS